MNYVLHPEAAAEHEEQVSYYEGQAAGLGARYHNAFLRSVSRVCEAPHRFRVVAQPDVRRIAIDGFPFYVLFRQVKGHVQILAVAHHRRRPGYWKVRL